MNRNTGLVLKAGSFMAAMFSARASYCQQSTIAPAGTPSLDAQAVNRIMDVVIEYTVKYSFQVLGGFVVIFIGWIIANILSRYMASFLARHKVDITVSKFLVSISKLSIIALAFLMALEKFGVSITPLIAGLSVVGFGASFALQGPLSNYAAGATLIFTKPFKVGDIIEVVGVMGEVEDMALARTQLKTVDGTKIVIPNKHIIGEVIHNYTDHKKVDINVGISYDSDVDKAISLVRDIVIQDKRVSQAPEPKVGISQFADSSINIYARVWCKQAEYWDVMFGVNKKINDEFRKAKITIPYPQRDVHIKSGETA